MDQSETSSLHNTQEDEEMAAAIDAMLRADVESEHEIVEGATPKTIAAMQDESEDDDPPVQVPFPKMEPVYAFPVRGIFIAERSYADFDDLGVSQGGTVALGQVLGTEEHPRLIHLRNCMILYKASAGERWLLYGHWYRFLSSDQDVVAVIASTDNDPRIANLQAIQQAEAAREVLFSSGRSAERIPPDRDWSQWP